MSLANEKGAWNPCFRELDGRQAGCYSNMLEKPTKYCPPTKTKRKKQQWRKRWKVTAMPKQEGPG